MRTWRTLAIALLLTACTGPAAAPRTAPPPTGAVEAAPSGAAPASSSGPQQLELTSRTNGWTVRALNQHGGPGYLRWLAPDRLLLQWFWLPGIEYHLIDLTAGTMTRLEGYGSIQTDSPDGRHVVSHDLDLDGAWLMDLTTGERVYQLPGKYPTVSWLSPTLLHSSDTSTTATLYDLVTKKETPLPGTGHYVVLLAGREVCYTPLMLRAVQCVPVTGGAARELDLPSFHPDATGHLPVVAWNRGQTHLAMLYPAATGARLNWWGTGTAHAAAMDPPAPPEWANEVAVYDATTGQISRHPLGGEYIVHEMAWSADGSHLGLSLGRMKRKGTQVTSLTGDEFWVLNLATGRLGKVAEATGKYPQLLMVTSQGEVVYAGDSSAEPLVAAPGGKARAWAQGLTMRPGPGRRQPRQPLAFVGPGLVEVRTQDGSAYRWPWEGTKDYFSVSMGPEAAWIALEFAEKDQMLFLRR